MSEQLNILDSGAWESDLFSPSITLAAASFPDRRPPAGGETPWGRADQTTRVAAGLYSVQTPSHGGLWVSPERLLAFPAELVRPHVCGFPQWFEEDCEWALVVLAFPDCFDRKQLFLAVGTARHFYAEEVERFSQTKAGVSVAAKFEAFVKGGAK